MLRCRKRFAIVCSHWERLNRRSCWSRTAWIWIDSGRRRVNSDSTKTILFAARLDPVKQPLLVADIAQALSILRPQRDFRFIIAGDGPQREAFERRVHKLGLDSLFDFRGQVDDLAPLYAACDVLLLPSRSEGVPLVVLEALASARPVVASKVGAIPEVLDAELRHSDRETGSRRIRTRHPLAAGSDRDLREKMGAAGRTKMEANHDIRKTREAFAGLFA